MGSARVERSDRKFTKRATRAKERKKKENRSEWKEKVKVDGGKRFWGNCSRRVSAKEGGVVESLQFACFDIVFWRVCDIGNSYPFLDV